METLLGDVRYGIRQLLKHPAFTILAIISLALGIGANTAIFSLVNTVLLRPLPVKEPSQLIEVYGALHNGADFTLQSYLNYKDYRDRNDVFSGLFVYRIVVSSLSHDGNNQRAWGFLVSGNYFDVLGVKPILGRGFLPEEDQTPGSHPVAVLSYSFWQGRFGGDPSIVGKSISLNNHTFNVVGVAPKGFIGPEVAYAPAFWVPMMMAKEIEPGSRWLDSRDSDNLFMIGRLKPGVTLAQAKAALDSITLQLAKEYPTENEGRGVTLSPPGLFIPSIRDASITFAGVLMVIVGLVLLLACVNLANLQLVRVTGRRKEIAIRLAVGASRTRLVRQLLTEGVLLSLVGGALGLLLAAWINSLVGGIKLPMDIALVFDLKLDWRVMFFALGLSILTGIAFSLLPALQSSKPALVPSLKDDASMAGFRRSRLRNSLVVAQVSLSLILLVSAGLIVRSLEAAQQMRPGFDPENAVALSFDVGLQGYEEARGRAFHRQVLERARALPVPIAIPISVSPGFFETMRISLRGRDFAENEDKKESRVAAVNETFATKFFPNQDPIGKRFNFTGPKDPLWQVIGVCGDGKYNSLGEAPMPAVFRPQFRDYETVCTLVVRANGDPRSVIPALRNEIQKMDATLPIYDVKTLTEHMNIPLFPARMAANILGSFGALALVLAAIGIYGVMSYVVAGRTREIGLRIALGAQLRHVRQLILRQGMMLAMIGLFLGLAVVFVLARFLTSMLYGVSPSDPVTFIGISFLLAVVALLACYIPARRAAHVDPMIALRDE
ncbi:MAG: ABC transporter permease [Verrucomicrobia bacterium]|nr:MAG: ABC transporter permease [Verrucomicrobiota bacterium]